MKKATKFATFYRMATQGILTMIMLMGAGFGIGYLIDKDSFWPPVLAAVGVLVGLVIFISYLLYLSKAEDNKDGKQS